MAPSNSLPIHGNEKTMNLNSLLLTNIQSSPYFKVKLYELKTYHEVIDEIYYKVAHLEPWEKGSRKTAGQTGMCGGVRGVGAGGIVSSAYCLLYKLFTLRLTRKQLMGLVTHNDSPFIRGLGFMYIRYTQPPGDLWEWYEEFLEDDEEIDVKAGGGHRMLIGEMLQQWLTKLEWYCTLFPRIPVPIQKDIEMRMRQFEAAHPNMRPPLQQQQQQEEDSTAAMTDRSASYRSSSPSGERRRGQQSRPSPPFDIAKEMARDKPSAASRSHQRSPDRRDDYRNDRPRDRHRHRSPESGGSRDMRRSRSRERHRDRRQEQRHRESSFDRDLRRERSRQERMK